MGLKLASGTVAQAQAADHLSTATGGLGLQAVVSGEQGAGPGQDALAGFGEALEALAALDQYQVQFVFGLRRRMDKVGWVMWHNAAACPKCRVWSRAMRNLSCLMSMARSGRQGVDCATLTKSAVAGHCFVMIEPVDGLVRHIDWTSPKGWP